eukprot:COSAG01_NODE_42774_length_436_cov_4.080119_2_plen_51_part_01
MMTMLVAWSVRAAVAAAAVAPAAASLSIDAHVAPADPAAVVTSPDGKARFT